MSGRILEPKLVIGGQDATGPAFKEIESKINKLANTANSVSRVSSAISGIGSKVNEASAGVDTMARSFCTISMQVSRAERQVGSFGRALHGLGGIAKGLGGIIATSLGFTAIADLDKAIRASADYQGQQAHLKYAVNATPAELAFAQKASALLPGQYTNQSSAGVTQTFGELLASLTNRDEAPGLLASAIATKSALDTEGHTIDPEDNRRIIKAAEISGRTKTPEAFDKFGEGIVRSCQMEGNLVTASDVLQFAQNAGSAARSMSDRLLLTIGPSLMGEQGGARSGAAMSQIYKTMTGASLAHAPDAVEELMKLGMLQKSDVLYNKQGNASGLKPGHMLKDAALGMSDFDIWMSKDLVPAMKAKGYDETQQRAAIARKFKGKIGPSEAELIMSQMPLIEQHQKNYAATGGRAAAEQVRAHDPLKAMADVSTALSNAATALTGPAMQAFAPAAEAFAKAVNSFVPKIKAFAESNPLAADVGIGLGAGAGSYAAWKGLQKVAPGIFGGGNAASAGAAAAGGSIFRSVPVLGMAAMGGYSAWQDPGHAFGGSGWSAAKRLWSGEDRERARSPAESLHWLADHSRPVPLLPDSTASADQCWSDDRCPA
jgi:hypothetical protein